MHRIYIVNILCKNKKVLFNLNCFTFIIDFGLDFVYLNVIVKCYKFVLFVRGKGDNVENAGKLEIFDEINIKVISVI